MMENGTLNGGVPINHNRDYRDRSLDSSTAPKMNGTNSAQAAPDRTNDLSMKMVNGSGGHDATVAASRDAQLARPARMNDLPDEIQHITSNFVPLGFLLERLAQKTHNNLQDVIRELARKPVAGMAVNGSGLDAEHGGMATGTEDGSIENVEKKKALLDFARSEHANWVKALVITEWSKKAAQISKLIDLENHMFEEELVKYEQAVFTMLNLKRNLNAARVPSPDLKTALQVLSQGSAPWMPDLGFIAPPPLTAEERLKWLDDISTLLSLRLNLEDHDTIPYHFRDYTIASGRVTFRVPNEFEVDLTLASDDFSEQLWFLDLRFLFTPAPPDLTDSLRKALEDQVNSVLATEGLPGCYRCLHEYVMTHKVNEIRRQALELGRWRWVETLKVEPLNRAIAVQYWATRYASTGLKSWFIIGVHSGRSSSHPDGEPPVPEERVTSRLSLRWFRDNKEVKDVVVPVDEGGTVSAEQILLSIAGLHIEHILSSIHAKLLAKPLFAKRLASMRLHISKTDPGSSFLEVQLTHRDTVSVRIDPVTGLFAMVPQSRIVMHSEMRINAGSKDPVEEGFAMLDTIRCMSAQEELGRRSKSFGWTTVRGSVIKNEELRQVVNLRDSYHVLWLKRQDWDPAWHILACLSLSGDRWWLVNLDNPGPNARVKTHLSLPLGARPADLDDAFFSDLTIFATGVMAQYADTQELIRRKKKATAARLPSPGLPTKARLPALSIRLSELLAPDGTHGSSSGGGGGGSSGGSSGISAAIGHVGLGGGEYWSVRTAAAKGRRPAWATDFVHLVFRGLDMDTFATERERRIGVLAEARLVVTDRSKFKLLGGRADHDVAFNARTGQFCLYLRAEVGRSVIDTLVSRLGAIERLVGILDAIRREHHAVRCEKVTLRKLVFSYGVGDVPSRGGSTSATPDASMTKKNNNNNSQRMWRVVVDLSAGRDVRLQLERGCPHLRVADFLSRVANDPATFEAVPFFLTVTLSLHRALDRLEDAWEGIQIKNGGMLGIFPRSLDWVVIRFLVPGPSGRARQIVLEIRLRTRRGAKKWQVRRMDPEPENEDDLTKALKRIFAGRGRDWQGMLTAAVASPFREEEGDHGSGDGDGETGIEQLIAEIDEGVRSVLPAAAMSLAQLQQRRAQAAAQAQAQVHAQAQAQAQAQAMAHGQGPQAQTARM